jgi:hypothetical protein
LAPLGLLGAGRGREELLLSPEADGTLGLIRPCGWACTKNHASNPFLLDLPPRLRALLHPCRCFFSFLPEGGLFPPAAVKTANSTLHLASFCLPVNTAFKSLRSKYSLKTNTQNPPLVSASSLKKNPGSSELSFKELICFQSLATE